ncbi:vWA domain-containing protein [Sulfuriroseicoccus oceanibius]|uniref:VWA domain-containing protein n=1 Tax=Sulfuriroseicoccus oceanibius TaxID=2707525 RepID=A0A6B3LD57_9BACT|nr:VWA domain-containing protein [Sulfuriroseicoccus oceanibius]QQL45101.1 VWA domain-containing protein [Sulfuriroseicoccus oceanibius]
MSLMSPEWLLLVPVFLLLGWWRRELGLFRPLRLACWVLLVLAMTRPMTQLGRSPMDLWLLADLSSSTGGVIEAELPELEGLIEDEKKMGGDRLRVVHYAAEAVEIDPVAGDARLDESDRHLTRTSLAVQSAAARAQGDDEGRPARVLVVTDGYSTEPLAGLVPSLQRANIPVDYRIVPPPSAVDVRVERLATPSRVQPGEPFLVEAELAGNMNGPLKLQLLRDGVEVAVRDVRLRNGSAKLQFTDRLRAGRAYLYEAKVVPQEAGDAYAGNNEAQSFVEVDAGGRILMLTKYQPDPAAAALRKLGLEVEEVADGSNLTARHLTGVSVVVINNVPAWEVSGAFLSALPFFVESQGGGLMMAGGRQSFAAGGYAASPIDELLPVSMELRSEHRKLAVALCIVMDRSGSMSAAVAGGTKMDLANSGAANALNHLGGTDAMAVFAVDSSPHTMVKLQPAVQNRDAITKAIRRIRSTGGGIFVYSGLKAGWNEIKRAPHAQKHVILFSDAADSEEPGDYKELLAEMRAEGATVSVIALGNKGDADAAFLEDIAQRGDGRIFFVEDAGALPDVFSQETVAVARAAFVRDPVPTRATGSLREIASGTPDWLDQVDGYNLSYLRPWARQALVSVDEFQAPLVAFGPRGTGRCAAVSMPLGAEYAGATLGWEGYEDFVQTLGRWLVGSDVPRGVALRSRIDGSVMTVDLLYDDALWSERFAKDPPKLSLAMGAESPQTRQVVWERIEPGRYRARVDLVQGEMVRGGISLGDQALAFGPLVASSGAEWRFSPVMLDELRQVAAATGGEERLDLAGVWERPFVKPPRPLMPVLLALVLVLVLADALMTRIGANRVSFGGGRRKKAAAKRAQQANQPTISEVAKMDESTSIPAGVGSRERSGVGSQRSRFERAKKGRR